MSIEETMKRVQKDRREGKTLPTQAGEFVREEFRTPRGNQPMILSKECYD